MDFPLPGSSDDLTSFAYQSGCINADHLPRDFSLYYGHDMLEEDALNKKSCMQVLKIWIDKADEDIVKLEEDILMLQCQLDWDDEKWSKHCSAALREKIDHLDILIECSKKDNRENGLQSETEELPPRLHDLLKPLLENYLAKSEHTETSNTQKPVPPAVELSDKKIEENASTIVLRTYERKSKSTELEDRKICLPQQKKDAVIKNFDASGDTCTNNEISKKVISKPSTLELRGMPNLVHVKLEPTDLMVNESSANTSIEKANSRENEEKTNNDHKAISEVKVIKCRIQDEIKVDSVKARAEASSKTRKERVSHGRAIRKSALSVKPTVKTKGRNTKILQAQEAAKDVATEMKNPPRSLNDRTEQVKRPRVESEHQIHVQHKICKECQQILQNPHQEEQKGKGASSTENLMEPQKDGVSEQETEQQVNNNTASEITAVTIFLPQEARISSLSSQTRSMKGVPESSMMKQAKTARDASNSTAEEATDGENNVPQVPSSCVKSKGKITLTQLRAIAKSQNLSGWYKFKKEDLRKKLGLE